jgi:hypothetical protein
VITLAMSAVINADRGRVWRALTVPSELIRWDGRLVALIDSDTDYPRVGQQVRWRYRLTAIPIILHERPLEVKPIVRFRSELALGPFCFDETYTLGVERGEPDRTRLALRLVAPKSVPVVGGVLDRFAVRRVAADFVDARLRSVRKWCEDHP